METRPTSPTSPSKTRSGPSSSLVWENGAGAASRTDFELKTDVLVLGGGAIGAATAYFLRLLDPGIDVTVVERAPTYKLASTPRASGGFGDCSPCSYRARRSTARCRARGT